MKAGGKVKNLDDLALKAGVTAATVSLALRNSPQLSEQMREKIHALARESGFTPRVYRRRNAQEQSGRGNSRKPYGPLLLLHYEFPDEPDPVRDGIMQPLFLLLNERKIEYRYVSTREVMENPALVDHFRGIIYYNDPDGFRLPPVIPAVQIFGWSPIREGQDRITANDQQIVQLVTEHFRKLNVERAAIVWCREMVSGKHPRIEGFREAMAECGVEVRSIPFEKNSPALRGEMEEYLKAGNGKVGLFAFNAFCGLKLCCALDSLGVLAQLVESGLVICDNSPLLYSFSPRPTMIDLNLSMMAEFALDTLCRRLDRPDLPETILFQSSRIAVFSSK